MKRTPAALFAGFLTLIALCHPAAAQVTIMPLGDSITKGAGDRAEAGGGGSGYRDQLALDLKAAGISFKFVGATTVNASKALAAAGQDHHNGMGTYRIDQLVTNFDGVTQPGGGADKNQGGYWLTGGHDTGREAVNPDIVLVLGGANDFGQRATAEVVQKRMTALLDWFKTNRPQSKLYIGLTTPFADLPKNEQVNLNVNAFNTWLKATITPDSAYGKAGYKLVDTSSFFFDGGGHLKHKESPDGIFLIDGVHPSHNAYKAIGDAWFAAIKADLH